MEINVKKVNALLSVFQASLYSHLVSVATDRANSESYLGYVPPIQINSLIIEESMFESQSDSNIIEAPHSIQNIEESPEVPEVLLFLHKHGKVLKKAPTVKNELTDYLAKCKGKQKAPSEIKTYQLDFEEIGITQVKAKYSNAPKVLQRLVSVEKEVKPARFIIPEESKIEYSQASLYGEVIATTYSQGGDGFVLHPGDFVSILQFLHEFGLVECKWQGMKGLFPQDKVKLMTRPSESLNTSISSLVSKQFLNVRPQTSQSMSFTKTSKLVGRMAKKTFE